MLATADELSECVRPFGGVGAKGLTENQKHSEVYSESSQTSNIELFTKIVYG